MNYPREFVDEKTQTLVSETILPTLNHGAKPDLVTKYISIFYC